MTYFLDTDTCIFIQKGKFACRERLISHLPHQIKIPAMVQAELWTGVRSSRDPLKAGRCVEMLLSPYEITPFDSLAAMVYAEIRSELQKMGKLAGPADLVIAATVLAHHGTLVTHNTSEFSRIGGLQLADWTR